MGCIQKEEKEKRKGNNEQSIFTLGRSDYSFLTVSGTEHVLMTGASGGGRDWVISASIDLYTCSSPTEMSLARSSVAFDPSPADPGFFEREKERLIEEISTVSRL